MNNLKILVLEDEQASADYLKGILLQFKYESVCFCTTLEEASNAFNSYNPDICIIDIYLKNKPDGLIFAEQVNQLGALKKPFLFLTSSHDSTIFQLAKFTAPHSYLQKPYNPFEIEYALELAMEKFRQQKAVISPDNGELFQQNSFHFVKRGNTFSKISLNDIIYIEVDGKFCKIICHTDKFIVQQSLKEIFGKLPETKFFRIHRNFVVNINEIDKINTRNEECILKNGESLLFTRHYIDLFLQVFRILK